MQKKLIVGGCSITHGAETVGGFMHHDNVTHSYSYHLAKWLDLELVNTALCGGSNEDIFHTLVDKIDNIASDQIHSVFVAWTGVTRLHWINNGRHWFFLPGWASTMNDLYDWKYHEHDTKAAVITGDSTEILDRLYDLHQFFVDHYLDDYQYLSKKLLNFKTALKSLCDQKKIMIHNVDIFEEWQERRHPTVEEHILLARHFYSKFYSRAENAER